MNLAKILALAATLLMLEFAAGYRTYIAAVGLLGLAVFEFAQGNGEKAAADVLLALGMLGLRDVKDPPADKPAA